MKAINEQYYNLRVTLESTLLFPSVLVVGSATPEDGSSDVACNLARAFADAGYRTVIVDPSGAGSFQTAYGMRVSPITEFASMASSATNGAIRNLSAVAVTGSAARAGASITKIRAAITDLRLKFDVIVINAGAIPGDTAALQFAGVADGVVLSFRFGRKPLQADRDATAALERVHANVLGVVAVGADSDRRPEPAYRPAVETPVTAQPAAWGRSFNGEVSPTGAISAAKETITARS